MKKMMKKLSISILSLLIPTFIMAEEDSKRFDLSGFTTLGGQLSTNDISSKFNEYRDIHSGFYFYGLRLEADDNETNRFANVKGSNLLRDDQNIRARFGSYGHWNLGFEWDETPHLLSNKAKTPYDYKGDGFYDVPATVSEFNTAFVKELVPTATQLTTINDPATAAYLNQYLRFTELGNQRKKGTAKLEYLLFDDLKFRLAYSNEDRYGNKINYGPIGDRPPRTLNIQLPEPIDYLTQELKFESEYVGKMFQVNALYLLSSFENNNDTLKWQNLFTSPTGNEEQWGGSASRKVATYGRRALPPDNRYQNFSLTFGLDLPLESHFTGTADYGWLSQNEDLIPYSTVSTADSTGDGLAWNNTAKLPRATAEAKINTKLYNFTYTINPINRLNLRTYYRFFDLDNNTPTDQWKYVTSDTVSTTGSVSYVNKRTNLAYAFDKKNYGLDTSYSINFWRTNFGLGYERENINRSFREADTGENIYRVSLRTRPVRWMSLKSKYQYGNRTASEYDHEAGSASYWYSASEATDNNDPRFAFENHPDTRRFDVTDRKRTKFDLTGTFTAIENLDISSSYRYRKDDFDSRVHPTTPLLNYAGSRTITDAARNAETSGTQNGLLRNSSNQYEVNTGYVATEWLTLRIFASREETTANQRGIEFNENNKVDPDNSGLVSNELGPWTRITSQWTSDIKDKTDTIGVEADLEIIPDKLTLNTDLTFSQGKVSILYEGFGTRSSINPDNTLADTNQFAFRTPADVNHNRYTFKVNLNYQIIEKLYAGIDYIYESYELKDWQQESDTPRAESVGSEYFLRDTSSATSNQVGNRLVNMGSYLAPSYVAQLCALSLSYKF